VQWWFKKWGVNLYIDTKRTRFSELDEENYEVRERDGTKSLAKMKIAELMELADSEGNEYEGIIMFANKDDALEKATLRGQQSRATMQFGSVTHKFGVLEVYSQDHKFVRLRYSESDSEWKYTGTTRERGSAFRQDVYVTIHEILHDIVDIIGARDGLHEAIEGNKFEEYAEDLCRQYLEWQIEELQEDVAELQEAGGKNVPSTLGFAPTVIDNPPIKYICIHHTAVSRASGRNQLEAVNNYHKNKNWGTEENPWYQSKPSQLGYYVGYNYFIDVNGEWEDTRVVGEETIAQYKHNCDVRERCDTISVCIAGDFNQELLSDEQIETARVLLQDLKEMYPDAEFVFHSELQEGRTCAGKLFTHDYLETRILQENIPEADPVDQLKKEEIESFMKQLSVIGELIKSIAKKFGLKI
jgi:hypothetical protein